MGLWDDAIFHTTMKIKVLYVKSYCFTVESDEGAEKKVQKINTSGNFPFSNHFRFIVKKLEHFFLFSVYFLLFFLLLFALSHFFSFHFVFFSL